MGIFSKKLSEEKKALLNEGKELGLNLDKNLSEFELRKAIDERKKELEPKPKQQPSQKRGEY